MYIFNLSVRKQGKNINAHMKYTHGRFGNHEIRLYIGTP